MTKESLAILVAQGRAFLDRQWDAFESQDRKIAGLFTLSTGLITVIPTLLSALSRDAIGWSAVPFAFAAVCYLVGLVLHWQAYRPSEVRLIGDAGAYYSDWLAFDDSEVMKWTLLDLAQAQAENRLALETKQTQMRDAAIAVALEAGFLFLGTLFVLV